MSGTFDQATLRRFMRTVRIATNTALAEHDLNAHGARILGHTAFRALAAKTAGAWRFPEAGLTSRDGMVLATLTRAADGAPRLLVLQAQGQAGLAAFAGNPAVVTVGGYKLTGMFDRNGHLEAALSDYALAEADLADFDLALTGDAQ